MDKSNEKVVENIYGKIVIEGEGITSRRNGGRKSGEEKEKVK